MTPASSSRDISSSGSSSSEDLATRVLHFPARPLALPPPLPPPPHAQSGLSFGRLRHRITSGLPRRRNSPGLPVPSPGRNRKRGGRGPAAEKLGGAGAGAGSRLWPPPPPLLCCRCPFRIRATPPWLQAEGRSGGGWARVSPGASGRRRPPGPPELRPGPCLQRPPPPPPRRLRLVR